MTERTEIIQHLINKIKAKYYLEIGLLNLISVDFFKKYYE